MASSLVWVSLVRNAVQSGPVCNGNPHGLGQSRAQCSPIWSSPVCSTLQWNPVWLGVVWCTVQSSLV
eukprot:8254674-Lingulodinium_polyedra.AAC.1